MDGLPEKLSEATLTIRKTQNNLPWPFFYSGGKQLDALSKDMLMIRPQAEDVTSQTISLLQSKVYCVVLLGVPGVVSCVCLEG